MGISTQQIGSLFTKIFQKGDPHAAMVAGMGPVTADWAKEHGYKQLRSPGIPTSVEVLKAAREGTSLYSVYAQSREKKKHIKSVKKETKKKKMALEERRRKSRIMRRPSRERGIL